MEEGKKNKTDNVVQMIHKIHLNALDKGFTSRAHGITPNNFKGSVKSLTSNIELEYYSFTYHYSLL